jgi:hypothetical protein
MPVRHLPPNPSLDHLKYQAKDLLKAHAAHQLEAAQRIREFPSPLSRCRRRGNLLCSIQPCRRATNHRARTWLSKLDAFESPR